MPGDICVLVESGRQIDRFFRDNPAYAVKYLPIPFGKDALPPAAKSDDSIDRLS
jgi:hypothetical protein